MQVHCLFSSVLQSEKRAEPGTLRAQHEYLLRACHMRLASQAIHRTFGIWDALPREIFVPSSARSVLKHWSGAGAPAPAAADGGSTLPRALHPHDERALWRAGGARHSVSASVTLGPTVSVPVARPGCSQGADAGEEAGLPKAGRGQGGARRVSRTECSSVGQTLRNGAAPRASSHASKLLSLGSVMGV